MDNTESNPKNSDFLQSEEWRKFQEATGLKTFHLENENFWANIVEHRLPIVGKYFYIPRGPIFCHSERSRLSERVEESNKLDPSATLGMTELINLAKKKNAGWIRIDPENKEILEAISKAKPFSVQGFALSIQKAPHDMQPREIFVIDITKPEEELLVEMKSKTRYNIKLAEKKGVKVIVADKQCHPERSGAESKDLKKLDSSAGLGMTEEKFPPMNYINEFLKLVHITASRDKITAHPDEYYRKMFETIPEENIKLYVAEYNNKVVAANIMIFYGNTAIYVHGASDNEYRNVMAPYLLQWQAILDAKKAGLKFYDFGGVNTKDDNSKWSGITRFKLGFSPETKSIQFSGSYDIILKPAKYKIYKILQALKKIF